MWSVARGKEVASCVRHNDVITCLAMDKDGVHVVTGSKDTTAIVWNITGRKVLGKFVIFHIVIFRVMGFGNIATFVVKKPCFKT